MRRLTTLFLIFCWIFWFSQILAISTICGLSDIPAESVVTLTSNTSDANDVLIDREEYFPNILSEEDSKSVNFSDVKLESQKSENNFIILSEINSIDKKNSNNILENVSSDNYQQNIDGSGNILASDFMPNYKDESEKPVLDANVTTSSSEDVSSSSSTSQQATTIPSDVNLTIEENQIPVFSEWAQKQMEEAEKKLEKHVTNSTSSKKVTTPGNKLTSVKLRAKNYASPDCGAKIIASNVEAQNTGALLSSSKDEYMLSPCTSRIWFVIELCEAIQPEKVDLANFELFSSSPKNFSVAVSNRFPTREWSNVGKFIAEDNRNVQSFDLKPHLFGKFVRVDVHSHYNSEHFCPISLFHVFGTSEFEAFETENRLVNDDLDEFDDDLPVDQISSKTENNLFKSASDAVMSIVKKAAEVLVKTNSNNTEINTSINLISSNKSNHCFTPKMNFICEACNQSFIDSVNYLLSCRYLQLIDILTTDMNSDILWSNICAKHFKLLSSNVENGRYDGESDNCDFSNEKKESFLLRILPLRYITALCHILNNIKNTDIEQKYIPRKNEIQSNSTVEQKNEIKSNIRDIKSDINQEESFEDVKLEDNVSLTEDNVKEGSSDTQNLETSVVSDKLDEIIKTLQPKPNDVYQGSSDEIVESTENVNIFNIVDKSDSDTIKQTNNDINDNKSTVTETISTEKLENVIKLKEIEGEQGAWESIDKLLSEHSSSVVLNNSPSVESGSGSGSQIPQKVQSESVFIRLSNRIKALERNMSLSGQYLEELSKRYKKQVEELQYSFTKTLTAIEEQNRNSFEREQLLMQQSKSLEQNVEELSGRVNGCISLIVCLIVVAIFQVIAAWFLIQYYQREQLRIRQLYEESSLVTKRSVKPKQLCRRKSVEEVSGHSSVKKVRRPSEEAMRISGSYKDLLITDSIETRQEDEKKTSSQSSENVKKIVKQKQRKMSVFYGKHKDIHQNSKREWLESVIEGSSVMDLTPSVKDGDLILDEDYESYIPGTDLAYNEFMPEGPSGEKNKTFQNNVKRNKSGKMRKLSSPRFISPFNNSSKKKILHEPTGWEWYRLRKSNSDTASLPNSTDESLKRYDSIETTGKVNGFVTSSTNSSLSEALQSNGSKGSDDSIRTSEKSTPSLHLTNGNTSKKRNSFRNIFKKVF